MNSKSQHIPSLALSIPWRGTYLEGLKGEETLRLGSLHPEHHLTSTFFLNPLGLA